MTRPFPIAAAAALVVLAAGLSACASADRVVAGDGYPDDVRARHPIVLADGARTLDVFAGRGRSGLDARQVADIRGFAADYAKNGRGGVQILVPRGDVSSSYALSQVERALGQGPRHVGSYIPDDPSLAAPIRLSFHVLKAQVASRCGLWPADLGPDPTTTDMSNRPYWNLGCAAQTALAAQVADPLDLVRPRAEGRGDPLKRLRGITTARQGQDSSTQYRVEGAKINQTLGAN